MNASKTMMGLTFEALLLTGSCYRLRTYAQQSSQAPSPEEEFLDAIKKGNSARVGEHKATQ